MLFRSDTGKGPVHEVPGETLKYEVGEGLSHEVTGDTHQRVELAAVKEERPLEVDGTSRVIYEMPAVDIKTYMELEGEGHFARFPAPLIEVPASARRGTDSTEGILPTRQRARSRIV